MKAYSGITLLVVLLAGFVRGQQDFRSREKCIQKCLANNKKKIMRPIHRLMCKLHCNPRHGGKANENTTFVHPGFNGKDAVYRN